MQGKAVVLCLAAAILSGAADPSGAQEPLEAHERFVCTFGSTQRTVSLFVSPPHSAQPAACRVDYTKEGKTQTLWTSQADRAYCTAKALALVTKLVEGNFTCKPQAVLKPEDAGAPE